MTLRSMTGFGRGESGLVACELRSVNGKGLDLRLRLPTGLERIEPDLRAAARVLRRGNVQATLTTAASVHEARLVVDQRALDTVLAAVGAIDGRAGTRPSSAAEILSLRGVLDMRAPETGDDTLNAEAVAAFTAALDDLIVVRTHEGASLRTILDGHLEAIDALIARARADRSTEPDAMRARLRRQLRDLAGQDGLDSARLEQEAALLATRADVREEIDRLAAHVTAARSLLDAGSPCGRKLEFLSQEFGREANTLCSKSPSTALTAIGLELKAVIDQFREQALNVE